MRSRLLSPLRRSSPFLVWLVALVALAVTTIAPCAFGAPGDVRAELDAEVVGLGDSVQLSMNASSDGASVDDPDPGAPASVRVDQRSVGPMHTVSIINGVRSEKRGVRGTWLLTPTKVGSVTIRPSVLIGGARVRAKPLLLKVVPAGRAPKPSGRSGGLFGSKPFDPFDIFKGADLDLDDLTMRPGAPPLADPNLAMVQAPRGKLAFLHARADKANAVVGEQVTYSVYLYVDAEQAEPRYDDVHEAGTKDFLRMSILPERDAPKVLGHTTIGGRLWTVKLLRRHAIFPLRAGHLAIAPMTLRVTRGSTAFGTRESERLFVDVSEPPAGGKPPGYVVGDVGRYKLSANVTPREVDAGGAITVDAVLEGTGNLPQSITPPPRKGVEWLPPDVRSNVAPNADGKVGGSRTFTFVVRAREAGSVDLGELTVPFFDPESGKYEVARAALGTLTVRGNPSAKDDGAARKILEGLPKPLASPQPPAARSASFIEERTFFFAWLAPPVALVLYVAVSVLLARRRASKGDRKETPKSQLKTAQSEAEQALARGDAQAADSAVRRFVESATQHRLGISIRAIELDRLARSLMDAGVDEGAANDIVRILRDAEAARFAPGGATLDDARARFTRAKAAVERLPAPKAGPTAAAAAAAIAFLLLTPTARAEGGSVASAAQALDQGKPEIAIAELEVLADRGVLDAHASFDRGLAYAERVRLGGGQTGDLGRAVHGFEEARRLSSDRELQRQAEGALHVIRAEIARQRARGEAVELESRSFGETLARLFTASGWGILACVASILASAGGALAFRLRGRSESAARRIQAGAIIVLAVAAPLSLASAYFGRDRARDQERSWAVVIAPETRALSAARSNAAPMTEGAIVEVTRMEAGRVEVRWGDAREWLSRSGVRLLALGR